MEMKIWSLFKILGPVFADDQTGIALHVKSYAELDCLHEKLEDKMDYLRSEGGISFEKRGDDFEITGINWRGRGLRTRVNWATVKQLSHLEYLYLDGNAFSALSRPVDMTSLPETLKEFTVGDSFRKVRCCFPDRCQDCSIDCSKKPGRTSVVVLEEPGHCEWK